MTVGSAIQTCSALPYIAIFMNALLLIKMFTIEVMHSTSIASHLAESSCNALLLTLSCVTLLKKIIDGFFTNSDTLTATYSEMKLTYVRSYS